MLTARWVHIVLVVLLSLVMLLIIRLHGAFGQGIATRPDVEAGRLFAQGWCTECHSVEPQTAGVGTFAPDFTVIARRRSARWLKSFLQSSHPLMPDFALKDGTDDDIVAYIVSLKR